MGISALAGRLGLAKSTVHRLATTLVEYDILEQNRESGKYRLGLALFELGTLVRRKMDAVSESRQQMSALLETTGETVQLAVLDHLSVLYIRILESRQAVRMSSTGRLAGARALHQRGQGAARLPGARDGEADHGRGPAPLHREHHHRAPGAPGRARLDPRPRLRDRLTRKARWGCAASPRRFATTPGLVSAAISVSAPVQRMTKKNLQTAVPTVVAAAEAISRRLGYLPSLAGAHPVE
jgi:DNA-binding IclR family transcriptional regulator